MINIVNFISKYPAKFILFAYVFAINCVIIVLACNNNLKVNYNTIFLVLISNALAIKYVLIDFITYIYNQRKINKSNNKGE